MTDEDKLTPNQRLARTQLHDAVARGLDRWREQRIGDPVPFILDQILSSTDPLGGYLITGGVVRLVQETDLRNPGIGGDSAEWAVYTEPDE